MSSGSINRDREAAGESLFRVRRDCALENALTAAWNFGRKAAQLDRTIQLALLQHHDPFWALERPIEIFFQDARDLVPSSRLKKRIEDALRSLWQEYLKVNSIAATNGFDHRLNREHANREMVERRCRELAVHPWDAEEWDLEEFHDVLCRSLVELGVALVERMIEVAEGEISEAATRMLRLGEHVEHGAYCKYIHKMLFVHPEDFDFPTSSADGPGKGSWWLATGEAVPGRSMPDRRWFNSVLKRWEELGFSTDLPEQFLAVAQGKAEMFDGRGAIDLVEAIDRCVRESISRLEDSGVIAPPIAATSNNGASAGLLETGYLGLYFDSGRQIVGRSGYVATINLSKSKVLWGLTMILEAKRDEFCNLELLISEWGSFGVARVPSKGTVYDAISNLKQELEELLEITIVNSRGMGWQLAEMTRPSSED